MISIKKILTAAAVTLFAALPLTVSAQTVADWQFSEANIKSGSIESGDLVIKDASGKGNDLKMRTYGTKYADTVSFSDESIDGKSGSIFLNGSVSKAGVDFVTVDSAPINKNSFVNGYTIEIIYKMPPDWTTADRWTSLLSRLGSTTAIDTENESVTTVVHVSNCKEIQFIPANRYNQSSLTRNVWSVAMDKAENWYSIVITGDNTGIRTFVNGCESFRDIATSSMQGLYADPNDGRFRIGARILSSGVPYRFTRGFIQEIRISDKALSKDEWLVPNPEQLVGDYGDNSVFEETKKDRYNMVFVPDTQNATKFRGDVMDIAMDWLIENKDYANIETVVSLGDNVEDYWETPQWEQISKNYASLAKSGIKTIVPAGNHDTDYGENYWYYNKYFGPGSEFDKLSSDYIISYSPSGSGAVADISAGSFPYKLVYIDMYQLESGGDMAWLEQALSKYSDCPVVLVMHDIQNCSDTAPNETKLSANGAILWNKVKKHDNVFLMVGGHSHGYGVLELENDYGNKVYSVLADYQFSYNGGNALCKFAEFDEKEGKIRISTFSPYAATLKDEERSFFDVNFMTGKGHYDEIDIDFKERFGNFKTYKAVGENIMTNPSFEDEDGNFSLEGWLSAKTNEQFGSPYNTNHCYAVGKTSLVYDSGATSSSANEIPDGNWAFGSRWNDGKDGLCSLKRYVKVEPGKTYIVSYKAKHKTGADGGYIITSLVANEGDDENSQTASSAGYIGTEWTTVEKVFTATEDTDHVLFWFRWLGGSGNTGDGPYWYFDDFSIREAEGEYVSFTTIPQASKDGETVTVTFDYNEKADSIYLVAGFDKDYNLICVATTTDGEATLTGSTIETVKVFSWSGINNIKPLATAKTVSVE